MKTLPFRPGQVVELRGQQFKIMATNHEGKLILAPVEMKEGVMDMMTRLQSTSPDASVVRAEIKEPEAPDSPPPAP